MFEVVGSLIYCPEDDTITPAVAAIIAGIMLDIVPRPALVWHHDPARDGSGCSWCGAWAQTDADNLCAECFD